MVHRTDFKNIENSKNDQPLKMGEKAKMTFPHSIEIPLFGFILLFGNTKIRIGPVKLSISLGGMKTQGEISLYNFNQKKKRSKNCCLAQT